MLLPIINFGLSLFTLRINILSSNYKLTRIYTLYIFRLSLKA